MSDLLNTNLCAVPAILPDLAGLDLLRTRVELGTDANVFSYCSGIKASIDEISGEISGAKGASQRNLKRMSRKTTVLLLMVIAVALGDSYHHHCSCKAPCTL